MHIATKCEKVNVEEDVPENSLLGLAVYEDGLFIKPLNETSKDGRILSRKIYVFEILASDDFAVGLGLWLDVGFVDAFEERRGVTEFSPINADFLFGGTYFNVYNFIVEAPADDLLAVGLVKEEIIG